MRLITQASAAKVVVPALLAAGWLAGLLGQRQVGVETGYLDVSPPLLLLGCGLFVLAGMATRILLPSVRRRVAGAAAGVAVLVAIVAGYAILAVLYVHHEDTSGETWFSLLLESWFWVGVPLLVSSALGAAGWWLADAADRPER
jgi:hypothetical protein